jgi:glycosyltransferase involved in cell wall biosynthesis
MRPVQLLFLMRDALPPFRVDVSVLFGQELPKLGIRSDLIGQADPSKALDASLWPAGRMWAAGTSNSGLFADLIRPVFDLRALLRHLDDRHNIIQVRDKIRTGVLALCVARLTGRRFVYWMSFPFAEDFAFRHRQTGRSRGWLFWLANALRARLALPIFYRWLVPHADHLFVQSEAMLRFMVGKTVPASRMTPVPMGIDAEAMLLVAKPQHPPERLRGRRVIAYLGQLARNRHSDFLLDVIAAVRHVEPQAILLLVGDGPSEPERQWFRNRIEELQLHDHVWLTGWLPQAEALPLVRCAEVGLSPIPRGELFDVSSPTKAVEYLALQIPCVANDIPDQKLVIEQSGGGLCVPMQVDAFMDAVLSLLRDAERARRMGAVGQQWVLEHRTYGRLAPTVAHAYRQLLDQAQ